MGLNYLITVDYAYVSWRGVDTFIVSFAVLFTLDIGKKGFNKYFSKVVIIGVTVGAIILLIFGGYIGLGGDYLKD